MADMTGNSADSHDQRSSDADETQEWLDALDDVLRRSGGDRVRSLLDLRQTHTLARGIDSPALLNTHDINSISRDTHSPYPDSHELEPQLRTRLRWNAIIMVLRANLQDPTIGGHFATYAKHPHRCHEKSVALLRPAFDITNHKRRNAVVR